jgi:hypothetical protein
MTQEYEYNHLITYTKRITGVGETNVFLCPYGVNIRLRLLKLIIFNEAGTYTTVKIFDHNAAGTVTDPPANGDATTPLMTIGVPPGAAGTTGNAQIDLNGASEIAFAQGMAVVASQASVQVMAVVTEA